MPFSLVFSAVPLGKIRVQAKENLLVLNVLMGLKPRRTMFADYLLLPTHLHYLAKYFRFPKKELATTSFFKLNRPGCTG